MNHHNNHHKWADIDIQGKNQGRRQKIIELIMFFQFTLSLISLGIDI